MWWAPFAGAASYGRGKGAYVRIADALAGRNTSCTFPAPAFATTPALCESSGRRGFPKRVEMYLPGGTSSDMSSGMSSTVLRRSTVACVKYAAVKVSFARRGMEPDVSKECSDRSIHMRIRGLTGNMRMNTTSQVVALT